MGRLIIITLVTICLIGMVSCTCNDSAISSSPSAVTPSSEPLKPSYEPESKSSTFEPGQTSPPEASQPIVTGYKELPSFSYIGITPPPGEPHRLYNLLLDIRWNTSWASLYKKGEFDCSEMSAFMENYLESKGFDTYILCAEIIGRDWALALGVELEKLMGLPVQDKAYHAWLAVNIDGEYMAVEPTIPGDTRYYAAYRYQYIFASASKAEAAYPTEFDYWNSPQIRSLNID